MSRPKNSRVYGLFLVFGIFLFAYRAWFGILPMTSGDWGFNYSQTIQQFSAFPRSWNENLGHGLGANDIFLLGLNTYYYGISSALFHLFRASWIVIEKLLWVIPFCLMAFFGPLLLYRRIIGESPYDVLGSLIYGCNSYILMIAGGGQMGIALAYAATPLVLYWFVRLAQWRYGTEHPRSVVITGLLCALLFMFDVRIFYIFCIAFVFIVLPFVQRWDVRTVILMVTPFIITVLLHAFWLLAFVVFRQNPLQSLGKEFTDVGMVTFLSFAPFEHTLSLLGPNWPENIFGKTYFIQPEFVMIPILAFAFLVCIGRKGKEKERRTLLFFAPLALLGAFLGKGTNAPFGSLYRWAFEHIPGFVMFRDPTKFYILVSLSYAVLIPYSLTEIAKGVDGWLKTRGNHFRGVSVIVFVSFLLFWVILHRQAFLGQLSGTFRPRAVPKEYIALKDYLVKDASFSRILWVPSRERYGYYSDDKPAISLATIGVASPSAFVSWIADAVNDEQLARYSVRYIVVPTDPLGELFVTDRTYNDALRQSVIRAIEATGRFVRVSSLPEIALYKTPFYYRKAYVSQAPSRFIAVQQKDPAQYSLFLPKALSGGTLVFAEGYDPYWEMVFDGRGIAPTKTADGLQKYRLPAGISGRTLIHYRPQDVVGIGLGVSGLTLLTMLGVIGYDTYIVWYKKHVS